MSARSPLLFFKDSADRQNCVATPGKRYAPMGWVDLGRMVVYVCRKHSLELETPSW